MPWAIYSDLSGVTCEDDMGIHATEQAALEHLVLRLESERTETVIKINKTKRRLRAIKRRNAA